MDYRTIINQLNTLKSEFIDYFNERKIKNDKDVADIVKTYLDSLEKRNVSLQVFKTRIIHNGHSVEKLIPIVQNRVTSLNIDLGNRDDFNKISESQMTSQTKKADLQSWFQRKKKERQEVSNRLNAIDRDLKLRIKENENTLLDNIKVHQQNINDLNRKMTSDILQIETKMIKDCNIVEGILLNENDLSEIDKLKEQIRSIRHQGLKEQFTLKSNYIAKIKEERLIIVSEMAKRELLNKQLIDETSIEIAENNLKLNIIDLENQAKDVLYDIEHESQNLDFVLEKKLSCLNLIKDHNEKLLTCEDVGIIFDNMVIRIQEMIIVCKEMNQYNPYIRVIEKVLEFVEEIKVLFDDCFINLNEKITQYRENIFTSFDLISRDISYKRHRTKEDIKENINECLKLLYYNESKLYDCYLTATYQLLFGLCQQLTNILSGEIKELGFTELLLKECSYEFNIYDFGYQRIDLGNDEERDNAFLKREILKEHLDEQIKISKKTYETKMKKIDDKFDEFIKTSSTNIKKLNHENKKRIAITERAIHKLLKNKDKDVLKKQNILRRECQKEIIKEEKTLKYKLKLLT